MADPPLSGGDDSGRAESDAERHARHERAAETREVRRQRADEAREARRERMDQARDVTRERVDLALDATRERVELAREATQRTVERARLTKRRLLGIDRSGPPPPETLAGQPWNVWTIPNAIGFVRLALVPVFLVLALSSPDGTDVTAFAVYAVIAWSDYADGLAARLTGQYSRFGALLDPIVDRVLVIAGVIVCWHFDLLPRWALAVLVARELFMLLAGQYVVRRGAAMKINWPGRLAVWPVMSAIALSLLGLRTTSEVLLYVGLALALLATVMYARDARAELTRTS
jgi:CDP-diacylglycerol---glycerol-3-phosphate 3-phosphatidyltransferase